MWSKYELLTPSEREERSKYFFIFFWSKKNTIGGEREIAL